MSAQVAAHGRLGSDPAARTSQAGNPWATASLAVSLSDDDDSSAQWFGLVAFGKVAETLGRHGKGDLLSVSGRLQVNRWRDRDGQEYERLQIVVDALVSAKTVRPGGGRRKSDGAA